MFQSLQNLFESTTPAMFYFWVAYFGFLLGLLLGFLFWFRHQLRYGRTQTKKRELVGEIAQLSAANQTMGEQLSSRGQTKPQVSESGSATGFGNQGSSRHESNESDSVTSDAFKSNSNPPGQLQVSAQSGQTTFGKSEGQGDHFDWSKVEGVSPGLAAQLKKMGIDNVEQIDNLSPADRESLEAKLAFEGYKWNWGWLSNWKTGAASAATIASGAIGAAGLAAASKLNATKPENLKINLPYSSAPKVDWSKVEGVDEKLAAELNSLGVKNIEQLKSLAGSERAKLEDRLKARGFNWNWSMLDRWKPQGFGQVSTTGSAEVSSAKASASSSISKLSSNPDSLNR